MIHKDPSSPSNNGYKDFSLAIIKNNYRYRQRLGLPEEKRSWLQFSLFWKAHKGPDSREELTQLIIRKKYFGSVLIFHLKNVINSQGTPESACTGERKGKVDGLDHQHRTNCHQEKKKNHIYSPPPALFNQLLLLWKISVLYSNKKFHKE